MDKHMWMKWGFAVIMTVLFSVQLSHLFFGQTSEPEDIDQVRNHDLRELVERDYSRMIAVQSHKKLLTHEHLIKLTTDFMEKLVQEIDEDYRVVHFQSKEELLDDFEEIMQRGVAKPYVDFYYEEREDGLYIVPTETPPWFNEKQDYDMIHVKENQVNVIQENDDVFHGHYVIKLKFTFTDRWKISNITVS